MPIWEVRDKGIYNNNLFRGFPDGPGVKTPAGGMSFTPEWGPKILHATGSHMPHNIANNNNNNNKQQFVYIPTPEMAVN